jgi:hypothetical protein
MKLWSGWVRKERMVECLQRRMKNDGRRIAGHLIPGCQVPPILTQEDLGFVDCNWNQVMVAPGFLPGCRENR